MKEGGVENKFFWLEEKTKQFQNKIDQRTKIHSCFLSSCEIFALFTNSFVKSSLLQGYYFYSLFYIIILI